LRLENNLANVLNFLITEKLYQIISIKSYEPAGCLSFLSSILDKKPAKT